MQSDLLQKNTTWSSKRKQNISPELNPRPPMCELRVTTTIHGSQLPRLL